MSLLHLQRLSNGSIDSNDEASQVVELQELLEKQNYEMAQMKERLAALSSRVGEVEQEAETTRKELIKTEEMNSKYQRDIREVRNSPRSPRISWLLFLWYPLQTDRGQCVWAAKVEHWWKPLNKGERKFKLKNSTRNLLFSFNKWNSNLIFHLFLPLKLWCFSVYHLLGRYAMCGWLSSRIYFCMHYLSSCCYTGFQQKTGYCISVMV